MIRNLLSIKWKFHTYNTNRPKSNCTNYEIPCIHTVKNNYLNHYIRFFFFFFVSWQNIIVLWTKVISFLVDYIIFCFSSPFFLSFLLHRLFIYSDLICMLREIKNLENIVFFYFYFALV